MKIEKKEFIPTIMDDYIPKIINRIISKINQSNKKNIVLFGFSDNMKLLYRILKENQINPTLCDWRNKYIEYDCGGKKLKSIDLIKNDNNTIVVCCIEEINELKSAVRHIIKNNLHGLKIIFDNSNPNLPFEFENPYKSISNKAIARAKSMISDEQLFDLIQFISQTANIEGDVVEFGSLYGGSGAVIAEAVQHFCKHKKIFLFDTFDGIPESKYGMDYHWAGSFSNNSFQEVKDAFTDLENVSVIKGNIIHTANSIKNKISFGYLASDTYETGVVLMELMWKNLSKGGVIAVCDYGSFPNCYPLTVHIDIFIEKIKDEVFVYRPVNAGIFILRK